ncbi:MAG TPA: glutathione S-transferase family protein, partial [Alphaproteobacteria bacterium]|nr:glutathione S-transferase family protein [Alphaproteobacteria bacterium]
MELYAHPISTTSRPILLFLAESDLVIEHRTVDLFSGENRSAAFLSINPNGLVPTLVDGDFRLTESSAILKYLADLIHSPAYPADLRRRSRVNERMDWINTNLYRNFGYDLVYPQIFPQHRRRSDEAQAALLEWGCEKSRTWLQILDKGLIGSEQAYLCGDRITIADYLGAPFVTIGEAIGCDFAAYPNIRRWLANMRRLRSWSKVF